ncbi:helix-turn-helix transcriptional regulator [Nocardia sp. N2S4-5]|uniref:helix-turn-helix transcriptional regulator n=1 Tax=Nocardia sp. N2S4-5 TaxID=3351565 RepID=UPI0037D5753C
MSPDLSRALRSWRERVTPAEAGLPADGLRRTPGLRREELASLAGISVDYLVRLEQGRARHPSPQVLGSLARALRLSDAERELLWRAAGAQTSASGCVPQHIGPGVARIMDGLAHTPVAVFTASWDLVVANTLWACLFELSERLPARERNLVWRHFRGLPNHVVHTEDEHRQLGRELAADLRRATAVYPNDRALAELIRDLRETSPAFAEQYDTFTLAPRRSQPKTIDSPAVGLVTLDCDVLTTLDSDLRIMVYSTRPGTDAASKLDLLRIVGSTQFGN